MGKLTICRDGQEKNVFFEGTPRLQEILSQAGCAIEQPCGGRGICGKCAVTVSGAISEPSNEEKAAGCRLSCQVRLLGDARVTLPDYVHHEIQDSDTALPVGIPLGSGFGAAVDIGTTTMVLKLFRLDDGKAVGSASCVNPQRSVAADVIGRISAALNGQGDVLRIMVEDAVFRLLQDVCLRTGVEKVSVMVIAGNTTMLYLLTGRNPESLSHAPFEADCFFGLWDTLRGIPVYYPRCMNAFVGADISCAILASAICTRPETALLCDIGTNGEIALWKDGQLFVTSTAAGPAFEGAGISCGCGSITGAIDRVWLKDGQICTHTIGDAPAVGICGSGLIDAVAAFLKTEQVDETGACEEDTLPLRDSIFLIPRDIREVQLAKAAIAAGIQTLTELAGIQTQDIPSLYIAGGFGSHLNADSAAAIGLIPRELREKVRVIGNASLTGAASILLNQNNLQLCEEFAKKAEHLNLGGNPKFNAYYMDQMIFELD